MRVLRTIKLLVRCVIFKSSSEHEGEIACRELFLAWGGGRCGAGVYRQEVGPFCVVGGFTRTTLCLGPTTCLRIAGTTSFYL